MLMQVLPIKNLLSRREQYSLPGNPSRDIYVIPVSGGADSMALAILMHHLYPEVNFRMIFTDTLADEAEIYTSLDKLEAWLGKKIERIVPQMGLYDLIDHYNGFLPSGNERYCTRELKLVPFKQWLSGIKEEGRAIISFVGVRADENTRLAFSDPDIQTEMPFIAMGVVREEVFAILEATVGIPRYYQTRTRSGCHTCPFQRKSEQVGLFLRDPKSFELGMRYEKLAPADEVRHPDNAVPLWKDSGMGHNHLGFALPMRIDVRYRDTKPVQWGKVRKTKYRQGIQQDLFTQGVWVGIEFFVHSALGMFKPTPSGCSGVWYQSLVTYSTAKAGLQKQLDNHYQHRLQTAEVMGLTQGQMREELHYAIYFLSLPAEHADTMPLSDGGYTWHEGVSYRQIRHIVGWAKRTLQMAGLDQQIAEYQMAAGEDDAWECERLRDLLEAKSRITEPCGTVVQMDLYVPKEVAIEDEFDERFIACPMCQI